MIELTAAEATALGWKHRKTRATPRLVDPSGNEYVRTVFGKSDVVIVQGNGTRLHLSRVAFRSGDSLLRVLRVPRKARP